MMSRRIVRSFCLVLVSAAVLSLVLGLAPRAAHATPFDVTGRDWEGASDFVALAKAELGATRVVPTGQLDMHDMKREDSIILLHPERTLDVDSLAAFMRAGGRVLLLDDYGTGDALLTHFKLERVAAPPHPAEMLRGHPAFAIAEPASAHPIASEAARVVTNHPTGLRHPDLSPVLVIRAQHAGDDGPEKDVVVAVAGAVGQGRFLAVGDPSIVMNSMLRYPGNKAFARGLVKYAADDDTWGRRASGKIYILSGAFEQKGSFGDEGMLGDDWRARLRNLQDALASIRRDGLSPVLAYILAIVAGLGVVLWIGSRAGRTHRPTPPRFTRAVPLIAQGGIAGHAAVIGAPHTSRVLAMLEIKAALEEDLCALLGLEKIPGHEALLAQMSARSLLSEEELRALKRLLLRLSSVETMVLSQRNQAEAKGLRRAMQPIRDREVLAVAKEVKKVLQTAHARAQHARDVHKVPDYAGYGA